MHGCRFRLDSGVRRLTNGMTLIGGSPVRVVRLSAAGAALLDRLCVGDDLTPVAELKDGEQVLVNRLLAAGVIHPCALPGGFDTCGVVVPVLDDHEGLAQLLESLRTFSDMEIAVVDDGSHNADAVAAIVSFWSATLLRLDVNSGPATARNVGWKHLETLGLDRVVFIDADVLVNSEPLAKLAGLLNDPRVGAAAPRVRSATGQGPVAAYERVASALDLGSESANVQPGSRVSYVPSACLAMEIPALREIGGFDEEMRVGEDVDLVWRLLRDTDWSVRFLGETSVLHRPRGSIRAFAKQRFSYGRSAADLGKRHPAAVMALEISPLNLAVFGAPIVLGRRGFWISAAAALKQFWSTRSSLAAFVDAPDPEALRLVARGISGTCRWVLDAVARAWLLPLLVVGAQGRGRWLLAASLLGRPIRRWLGSERTHDVGRFVALSLVDDVAYLFGTLSGAIERRTTRPLRVRLRRT